MLRQCFAISWDSQLTICSPTACRWPAPTELTVFSYVSSKCRNWACFSCSHSSYIAHQQASTLSYHSQSVFNSNSSMDQFSQISHVILLPHTCIKTFTDVCMVWRHGIFPTTSSASPIPITAISGRRHPRSYWSHIHGCPLSAIMHFWWLKATSGTVCHLTSPQLLRWLFFGTTSKLFLIISSLTVFGF